MILRSSSHEYTHTHARIVRMQHTQNGAHTRMCGTQFIEAIETLSDALVRRRCRRRACSATVCAKWCFGCVANLHTPKADYQPYIHIIILDTLARSHAKHTGIVYGTKTKPLSTDIHTHTTAHNPDVEHISTVWATNYIFLT